jgi:ferredoxin
MILIDHRCTACGLCLVTCPEAALRRAPQRPSLVDARCTDCLACIEVCPVDAISELAP